MSSRNERRNELQAEFDVDPAAFFPSLRDGDSLYGWRQAEDNLGLSGDRVHYRRQRRRSNCHANRQNDA
jgi:hypothetical protein